VRLLHVDEMDSLAPSSFDFVHSFIVFQHIPVDRGEDIFSRLVGMLADGGVGALHFTFRDCNPLVHRGLRFLRQRSAFVEGIINLVRGRPFNTSIGQMNCYSIDRLFHTLVDSGCSNLRVEFSNHGGFLGAMLYFEKTPGTML
jgi:hypothetical protein